MRRARLAWASVAQPEKPPESHGCAQIRTWRELLGDSRAGTGQRPTRLRLASQRGVSNWCEQPHGQDMLPKDLEQCALRRFPGEAFVLERVDMVPQHEGAILGAVKGLPQRASDRAALDDPGTISPCVSV